MDMDHRQHSRYATRIEEDRPRRTRHSKKKTEELASDDYRYSRYIETDQVQPKRRRWAAGYIDRPSCASHAYICTRHRSPDLDYPSDMEYITQPKNMDDGCIEAHEQRNMYTPEHTTEMSKVQTSRYRSPPRHVNSQDDHRHTERRESYYASDIEDLDHKRPRKQATTTKAFDSGTEEGSDIVIVDRRDAGSDIASISSRHSSDSRSGRHSIKSFGDRKRTNRDSDSDDEGGYISLDDYITGRSDCASKRSLTEDEGEGSDAVNSDVEVENSVSSGSDADQGSDIAALSDDESFDDDEDCIDDGNYHHALKRQ
ncbi:uncharacterized protein M421DRAFT_420662 [Didymella exigua CBS 183.55]|uniref:Uncharacterized protein n=1 Tax=Didymella exigua CBS 183.55 TaxID=1150837 RepID=A0A6A5RR26_9PLEO|nr:uncharacterized protein M421DRAFT_420662 [Didymella exigua CBS 183.55]KAF1928766.1 hypothetical protein M421DRAFT_420662 [Didymella exigua CBS 183.55]